MPSPNAIDEHPGCQWCGGGRDGAGEFQSTGIVRERPGLLIGTEHLEKTPRGDGAGRVDVATEKHRQIAMLSDPKVHPSEIGVAGIDEDRGVVNGVGGRSVQERGLFQQGQLGFHGRDLFGS